MAELAFQREQHERRPRRTPIGAAPDASAALSREPSAPDAARALGPGYAARPCFGLARDERPPEQPLPGAESAPEVRARDRALAEHVIRTPDAGAPLESALRAQLTQRLGRDLRGIRVHTGERATRAALSLGSVAFTRGQHIYLASSRSARDAALMAHEVTHAAQQGAAPPLRLAAPQVATAPLPRAVGAPRAAAAAGPGAAPAPVQRIDIWGAARRVGGAVASGVRTAAGAVADVAGDLTALGRDALMAVVRRVAPDFLPLFEGDGIGGFLRRLISRGFRSLFEGLMGPLRAALNVGNFGQRVGEAASWLSTIAGQLANNDCSGILAAARRVGAFFSGVFGPVVDRLKQIARSVSGFFRGIWDAIGAPIMDALRRIGGEVWRSLQGFVRDVGALIRRVRAALGGAFTRVKGWLGIGAEEGAEEGGGLWNWIRDKASSIGSSISQAVRPIMGPLRVVGSVLLMIIPGGQLALIMLYWPQLRQAFNWVSQTWQDLNLVVRAREFVANTVVPTLISAAESVAQALLSGADWLLGLLDNVSGALAGAAAGATGVFAPLGALIRYARGQFSRLVSWARGGLRYVSRNFRSLVRRLIAFLRPIGEALAQLIGIVTNPFGISGFLLGSLWRLIADCLKGPIIDFIIDIIIRVLRALPPLPMLGILWPFVKAGLLGFFERLKRFAVERKVNVSNKVARIISGQSAGFALGLLRGLALGLWEGIIAPFQAIALVFELPERIQAFLANLGVRLCDLVESIRCFAASLAGQAFGGVDRILAGLAELLENPGQIVELIRCAIEGALGAAESLGATIAERVMAILEGPEDAIGEMLGRVAGNSLVQAVITYFTAGAGAAVGVAQQVSSVLSAVGRALGQALRMLQQLLGRLVGFLRSFGARIARMGSNTSGAMGRLRGFFRRVVDWFKRLFARLFRRRGRDRSDNTAQWLLFKAQLRALAARHAADGASRARLSGEVSRLRARFPTAVHSARVQVRPRLFSPFWVARAKRKRGALLTHLVPALKVNVLQDAGARWPRGARKVRQRLRRIRPADANPTRLTTLLQPIKTRWHFKTLHAVHDPAERDLNIMGSMSPEREIDEVDDITGLHTGTSADPIPIYWYKDPSYYIDPITVRTYPGSSDRVDAPMVGNTRVRNRRNEERRLGISPQNLVTTGRVLRMRGSIDRSSAAASFGRLLQSLGFSMRNRDADHVRDLAFGGPDASSNLWPLRRSINQIASTKGNWYSRYRIEYAHRGKRKEKVIRSLRKHFRIIGYRERPPSPGGRDGT